jgi:hypothetical protein
MRALALLALALLAALGALIVHFRVTVRGPLERAASR